MNSTQFHKYCFIVAIAFYAITAWFANGYYHADEQFQIIEFAGLKSGFNQADDLAWEYEAEIRPSLQPTIAFSFISVFNWFTSNPYIQAFLLRLITATLALFAIRRLIISTKDEFKFTYTNIYIAVSYFLWFLPLIFTRFSSEAWSGIFLILAIAELLKPSQNTTKYFLIVGAYFGLAFLFRYQTALVSFGLVAWMIFIKKHSITLVLKTLLATTGIIIIGIAVDSWFYGKFIITAWNYFDYNILQDVASSFGTKPILWYFYAIIKFTFLPLGVLIGLSFLHLFVTKPKSIYIFAVVPLFAVHSLIPHKEIRFLFPMVFIIAPVLMYFVQYAITTLKDYYKPNFKIPQIGVYVVVFALLLTNIIGLAAIVSKTAGESVIHQGQYIYNNYQKGEVILYHTSTSSPYKPFGVPLNFYAQDNVTPRKIISLCDIENFDITTNRTILLSFSKKDRPDLSCLNKQDQFNFKKLTQSWPNWLVAMNKIYPVYDIPKQSYLYEVKLKR